MPKPIFYSYPAGVHPYIEKHHEKTVVCLNPEGIQMYLQNEKQKSIHSDVLLKLSHANSRFAQKQNRAQHFWIRGIVITHSVPRCARMYCSIYSYIMSARALARTCVVWIQNAPQKLESHVLKEVYINKSYHDYGKCDPTQKSTCACVRESSSV